jgi:hypothetical protein
VACVKLPWPWRWERQSALFEARAFQDALLRLSFAAAPLRSAGLLEWVAGSQWMQRLRETDSAGCIKLAGERRRA